MSADFFVRHVVVFGGENVAAVAGLWVQRQLLDLGPSWPDQISRVVLRNLLFDILQFPPSLDVRHEGAREELVGTEDF